MRNKTLRLNISIYLVFPLLVPATLINLPLPIGCDVKTIMRTTIGNQLAHSFKNSAATLFSTSSTMVCVIRVRSYIYNVQKARWLFLSCIKMQMGFTVKIDNFLPKVGVASRKATNAVRFESFHLCLKLTSLLKIAKNFFVNHALRGKQRGQYICRR
jgi:enamine deaminase RidA (YjgF/YER057c/UK114 family)